MVMEENKQLKAYLKSILGDQITAFWNAKPEPRAIRVNTLKTSKQEVEARLRELGVSFKEVSFNPLGLIIEDDFLPLSQTIDFFLGKFYYQGVSSQIPPLVLNPQPDHRVLDMTASPGSKSTQIAALMENKGFLVLNDFSLKRLQALNTNIQKVGAVNYAVYRQQGERIGNLLPEYFDKVLLDAPCTALGIIHSHPEVYSWWTQRRMQKIIEKQRQLLISAYKALKVGGEMVYSTCSIAPEENEALIQFMLDQYPLEIVPLEAHWHERFLPGFTEYNGQKFTPEMQNAIRIFPHVHDMEGFFVIKLRKIGKKRKERAKPKTFKTIAHDDPEVAQGLQQISEQWGIPEEQWPNYRFIKTRDRLWMVYNQITEIPEENFLNAGLLLGEKRISGWKLPNDSIQYFSRFITKRHLTLGEPRLLELFKTGMTSVPEAEDGYFALSYKGQAIGSLFVQNRRAKMRLMHRFKIIL